MSQISGCINHKTWGNPLFSLSKLYSGLDNRVNLINVIMTNNLLNLADLFRREINRVATNIMPHKLQRFLHRSRGECYFIKVGTQARYTLLCFIRPFNITGMEARPDSIDFPRCDVGEPRDTG